MNQHRTIPGVPVGYPLSPCRGMWSVVVPAAATNLIINPSFELVTTGYTTFSSTIARTTDWQQRGVYGLSIDPSANTGGVYYAVTLAPNTTYTWSMDEQSQPGMRYAMRVWDDTAFVYLPALLEYRGTGMPERRRLTFVTGAGSTYWLSLGQNGGSITPVLYADGWQLTQLPYDTTYIDGDQPGCAWTGNRHASTSSRSAQTRRGGRVMSLDTYGFTVTAEIGLGMGPTEDISTPMGLLGGAYYQRTVQRVRTFSLVGAFMAASLLGLQRAQADLQGVLTAFAVSEQQPLALRYRALQDGNPIGDELELLCHYTGGLEGNTDNPYQERCALQFAQYLPQITSIGESAVALGTTETIADADYIVERQASGVWRGLAGGLDGPQIYASVYGPDGMLYVGGLFIDAYNAAGTGSPVAVNMVARWSGTSWSALGAGFNTSVRALAFDAAGTLYAGGNFTNAAYPYLAKWDGVSWTPVGVAADATGAVYALAFDAAGNLYVGGTFANWGAIAAADNIVRWNGTTWSAPAASGANDSVYDLALSPNTGNMIAAGAFTTIGGTSAARVATWNGTTYLPLGSGFNSFVYAIHFDLNGRLYAGGAFTDTAYPYIAGWNGTAWEALGTGINGAVFSLGINQPSGILLVGGAFTTASTYAFDQIAQWTGSAWIPVGIDLPGTATVRSIGSHPDGRLAFGFDTSGSATSSIADTDVVNDGSAPAAPVFVLTGMGRPESIINQTTGKAVFLNVYLYTGEILTIDLTPGAISVVSSMRGNIGGIVLPGSHLSSWRLQPGINTVIVKSSAAILMRWRTTYQSIQGAALS